MVELAGQAEVAGHPPNLVGLVGEHETDAGAAAPGASGAADAVHVGVAVARGVEVDHVGDAVDVDSAGGDVGRDQGIDFARSRSGPAPVRAGPGSCRRAWRRPRPGGLRSRLASRSAPRLVRTKTSVAAALVAAQLVDQVVELGALGVDVEEAVLDVGLVALVGAWVWRRASRV